MGPMGQESNKRTAAVVRYITARVGEAARATGATVAKKDVALALGIDPSLVSHIMKDSHRGASMQTALAISRASGIPIEILVDESLPIELVDEHLGQIMKTLGLRPKRTPKESGSHPIVADAPAKPKRADTSQRGVELVIAMEKTIDGVVEYLGLDLMGKNYVSTRLRVEAMRGRLADRWAVLERAAQYAREYDAAMADSHGATTDNSQVVKMRT